MAKLKHSLDLSHLGELPEPLDPDDLQELVAEFKDTGSNREVIITTHIRLAISYASWFTARCPRKEEEFICESFFKLIVAVDKFRINGRDNNITPYIAMTIRYGLLTVLVEGRPVKSSSKRTWQEQVETFDDNEVNYLRDPDKVLDKENIRLELRDVIEHCARNERDWKIILSTYEGYTIQEIADSLGEGFTTTQRQRTILFDRFIHFWTKDD